MIFRVSSAIVMLLGLLSAYLQLNDPDPERWFAFYFAAAVVAGLHAWGRPVRHLSLVLGLVALAWAAAIAPELLGKWTPRDLGASMSPDRPELEFGREFGGTLIVAAYCACAFAVERRMRVHAITAPSTRG